MDIREFYKSNQKQTTENQHNFNQSTTENSKQNSKDFNQYQETIDKYKDLSQQDLYKELFSQASELKSQGKLDLNMLNTLSSTLSPMLNNEQQELLNNLIDRIK